MLYVALETQQKPYDQPVRQERATTCHSRLRFAGFTALRHASYPEPCSMQNYKYNHKYNSSSLTRRNKLHVTQQSHQSSTTVPSSTGEGRSVCVCMCVIVWLCDCISGRRRRFFCNLLSSRKVFRPDELHKMFSSRSVGRIMFLVRLCTLHSGTNRSSAITLQASTC